MVNRLTRVLVLVAAMATIAPAAMAADTAHKPGLLEPNFFSALWVVIIFLVLLIILYPTAWKNVLAGLKAREQRIRTDIAEAEAARGRAEATLREYNAKLAAAQAQVNDMIAQATAQGEQVANNIRTRAEQEAQEIKDRSMREIESARKQAVADIYEHAATLATSAAEKIIRRNLNAEDQRDLVQRSLEELQTVRA
jgi:F-type H+-transporting ATPase subunit b